MDTTQREEKKLGLLKQLLEQVNISDISSLRQNMLHILSLVHNPATTAKELTDAIETDPPLCARILRVANSAYYGTVHRIGAIREAIIWLGFNTIKELAVSQKVCELFDRNGHITNFSLKELWHHSLLVAVCGKLIYRREYHEGGEEAFTAGLLHELGLIVEVQFRNEAFSEVLQQSTGGNLADAEHKVLGYDHSEVGGMLADDWGFPHFLAESIRCHHAPNQSCEGNRRLAQTLYLADYLTHQIHPHFDDQPVRDDEMLKTCLHELSIEPEALDLFMKELESERQRMVEKGLLA